MEITPAIDTLIVSLAQQTVRVAHTVRKTEIERDRRAASTNEDPDHRQVVDAYYDAEQRFIDDPSNMRAAVDLEAARLRQRAAVAPAPPMPEPLRTFSWQELINVHPDCHFAWWETWPIIRNASEVPARALGIADGINHERAIYHEHRVADVQRYAYAAAFDVSPNRVCFTQFQQLASQHAQRIMRRPRAGLTSQQDSALAEARVIAQAAAVYLRRLAKHSRTERSMFGASLAEFKGVSMWRASEAAAVIGSEGPAAGMVHALYGALFTSSDKCLNEKERDWNGARIHLTHASHIFGAFQAHNNNVPFDPPLENLITKMRDDVDAGRDVGPIEPVIYALADALTDY